MLDLAHLVAVTRPGHDVDAAHLPEGAATIVEVPALAISSTDCRQRVSPGGSDQLPGARRGGSLHRQDGPVPGWCPVSPKHAKPGAAGGGCGLPLSRLRRSLRRRRLRAARHLRVPRCRPRPRRCAPSRRRRRRRPAPAAARRARRDRRPRASGGCTVPTRRVPPVCPATQPPVTRPRPRPPRVDLQLDRPAGAARDAQPPETSPAAQAPASPALLRPRRGSFSRHLPRSPRPRLRPSRRPERPWPSQPVAGAGAPSPSPPPLAPGAPRHRAAAHALPRPDAARHGDRRRDVPAVAGCARAGCGRSWPSSGSRWSDGWS